MDNYENWGTTEKTELYVFIFKHIRNRFIIFIIAVIIICTCFSLAKCHEFVNSSKSEYSLTITNSGNPTGKSINKQLL